MWSRQVANDQAAIEAVIHHAAGSAPQVRWAVDVTSGGVGLLLALLVSSAQPVVYVPGRVVNRMTGAFGARARLTC